MSSVSCRTGVGVAVLTMSFALMVGRSDASHFAWLGHTACPWGPARCESEVPAGFTKLGEPEWGSYRILDEAASEWQGEASVERLLTRDGTLVARVGRRFRQQLELEGTARLRDGRIVNVEEMIGGTQRYLVLQNAPYGIGAPGYQLVPYRTVSVNPKHIPIGTVLYLPSLAGLKLPTGEIHDGFCFAHDTPEGATDNTIALFVGFYRDAASTLGSLATRRSVAVYRVDDETATVLNRRFKGQFDWSG